MSACMLAFSKLLSTRISLRKNELLRRYFCTWMRGQVNVNSNFGQADKTGDMRTIQMKCVVYAKKLIQF
jgi:hypothetical protein